jgi:predicted DNA-binding protein (MmcQ/YjbR family)
VDILNLKCGPVLLGSLLGKEGYLPAYHMSKGNWVSIRLDGTVPEEDIFWLLGISYDLTRPKGRKKP